MKKLIDVLSIRCKKFTLKYLLYEETDIELCDMLFYSLLTILFDEQHNEFAQAKKFTSDRTIAYRMLNKISTGKVTPVGLHYIIEDFIAEPFNDKDEVEQGITKKY